VKDIVIAIDGYSSCGKSTLAKAMAKKLNYTFIDSGAMYRGVALYALRKKYIQNGIIDKEALIQQLSEIRINFRYNALHDIRELYLNNENVETEIRSMEVAAVVSYVAAIKEVRQKMVEEQQTMGKNGGVVMDGRDIGSVVFPKAELKFFIKASIEVRTKRRFDELAVSGKKTSLEEVKENLLQRDLIDTSRTESPLIQVEDAIVIDNTNLNQEEQLAKALSIFNERFNKNNW
jgi:cytidylate kinase